VPKEEARQLSAAKNVEASQTVRERPKSPRSLSLPRTQAGLHKPKPLRSPKASRNTEKPVFNDQSQSPSRLQAPRNPSNRPRVSPHGRRLHRRWHRLPDSHRAGSSPTDPLSCGQRRCPGRVYLPMNVTTNRGDRGYILELTDITPPGHPPPPYSSGSRPPPEPVHKTIPVANLAAGARTRFGVRRSPSANPPPTAIYTITVTIVVARGVIWPSRRCGGRVPPPPVSGIAGPVIYRSSASLGFRRVFAGDRREADSALKNRSSRQPHSRLIHPDCAAYRPQLECSLRLGWSVLPMPLAGMAFRQPAGGAVRRIGPTHDPWTLGASVQYLPIPSPRNPRLSPLRVYSPFDLRQFEKNRRKSTTPRVYQTRSCPDTSSSAASTQPAARGERRAFVILLAPQQALTNNPHPDVVVSPSATCRRTGG